jgi:hypothetical protein
MAGIVWLLVVAVSIDAITSSAAVIFAAVSCAAGIFAIASHRTRSSADTTALVACVDLDLDGSSLTELLLRLPIRKLDRRSAASAGGGVSGSFGL